MNTLEKLYLTDKLSTRAIAEMYGVRHITIRRWLISYGIPARPNGRGLQNRGIVEPSKDDIYRMVHQDFLTYPQIAEKYGVDSSAIRHWLIKHSIPMPELGQSRRKAIKPSPELSEVANLYESGQSLDALVEKYSVCVDQIKDWLSQGSVNLRDGGWNKGQRFTCDDGHRVRSTYELRVDNWLSENGIDHIYEPSLPFDKRSHADFLANGWFIEIWGVTNLDTYKQRKTRKQALYQFHQLPLIEISAASFTKRSNGQWKRSLRRCLNPHD